MYEVALEAEEDSFLDDLQKAVGELKVVVESSMSLGQLVVDKSTNSRHHSIRYCIMPPYNTMNAS